MNPGQDSVAVLRNMLAEARGGELLLETEEYEALEAAIASLQAQGAAPGAAAAEDAEWSMTRAQVEQWIDACNHSPAREALRHYLQLREAALATPSAPVGVEGLIGRVVSVDISTGDDDFDHRIFAEITGDNGDGTLLAEMVSDNHATPAVSVGDAVRAAIEAIPSGYFNFLGEHTQYENRTAVADLVVAAIASKGDK